MALTPMMQQYLEIHEQAPDAILLFRLGDFYEMFFDDAITASKVLSLVLTGRDCGLEERAPMCGVPYHAVDTYIAKLVKAGHKVAICEQTEDPAATKGLVKREIIKIISPGTVTDEKLLEEDANNYLMCIYAAAQSYAVAYIDISTAEFFTCLIDGSKRNQRLLNEVAKLQPKEIICNTTFFESPMKGELSARYDIYIDVIEASFFSKKYTLDVIKKYFNVYTLQALGLDEDTNYAVAIGAVLLYLEKTQKRTLSYIKSIVKYTLDETMPLDAASRRNLEITSTMRSNQKKGSLLWVLDKTQTAMGARKLKYWLENPLRSLDKINERLDSVEEIRNNLILMDDIRYALGDMYDMQRIATRICAESCSPKDMLMLRSSVANLIKLKRLFAFTSTRLLSILTDEIDELDDIAELIERAIDENAPTLIKDGGMIKEGYDEEVDHLKALARGSQRIMDELEAREKQATGIKTLKVKYNKVFGYYIEVSNNQKNQVPEHYMRKQTLVNAERYYTDELKQIEVELLSASERLKARESKVYENVRLEISKNVHRILKTAEAVASIDVLASFAYAAYLNNYIKPTMNRGGEFILEDSRHPVVEKMLDGESFIANNCHMNQDDKRLAIITGPNMAGKSTYIRQIALIVLMAQCGSFVPAAKAQIPLVDRIFTRVGASDDIVTGKSTFMVEMSEVANILKNATSESLVILDEIGRGTSTFDGLSIAWAIAEYISEKSSIGAKTLFATHYHELTELESTLDGAVNLCIKVKETPEGVVFLRKIEKGIADKSYGIEVARLAGLPSRVLSRARDILHILEEKENIKKDKIESLLDGTQIAFSLPQNTQSHLSQKEIDALEDLKALEVNALTPLEAMLYLNQLQERLK